MQRGSLIPGESESKLKKFDETGSNDSLVQGGVIEFAGELPGRYMQATVAGIASSGEDTEMGEPNTYEGASQIG